MCLFEVKNITLVGVYGVASEHCGSVTRCVSLMVRVTWARDPACRQDVVVDIVIGNDMTEHESAHSTLFIIYSVKIYTRCCNLASCSSKDSI